ncbi:MAG: glycine cleavage system protein GcvH [Phycisphaeraceae bacterium]|nr:glycine cleavage system protein GcvH [Phycisphaeraceae bacterium]MCW5763414.1 glycine cleavage system protein GcvH [Phycisphaeraceae bacterium]
MATPDDRRYSSSHEWHRVEGDLVAIGLTRYAVDALTDVTYVELKKAGTRVASGDSVGEVESVKTTSDVYSALDGEIVAVNGALESSPGLLNEDPYEHWLVRIKPGDLGGLADLMDAATYDRQHAG